MIIDDALRVIANLQQEIAQLRKENRHLRRSTDGKHPYHRNTAPRVLRRALDDSMALLTLAFNDYPISRQFCYELGYSERRYYWAVGLLRSARVMAPRGRRLLIDEFSVAEQQVHSRYQFLKSQPNALELLRIHMPKKMGHAYTSRGKL